MAMAAIAAAIAAAMATPMATMAPVAATVATAVAAMTGVAAIAATAAMAERGQGLAFTAHEGNTNQREKQRETEYNDAIHPQILQLLTGTGKWTLSDCRQRRSQGGYRRLSAAMRPCLAVLTSFGPEAVPVVNFYGLRRM
jgi:hypothetical protein